MPNLIYPPSQNGLQKQLDADLNSGVTASMTLTNTTGVQNKPGVVVINRIDTNGNELASSSREYISFTGTSGATLTGLSRGLGGTSDQDHSTGAVVEFILDVVGHQAINDVITAEHGTDGTHTDVTATTITTTGNVDAATLKVATSTVSADDILDEDDFASDSATALITQQSAKAYVDTYGTSASMARQAIINGNFDVWQRGTSFTTPSANSFTADRWQISYGVDGGTLPTTHTHAIGVPTPGDIFGSYFYHKLTVDGAGSGFGAGAYYQMNQRIEKGTRFLCGASKTVTVSFWAKSDIADKKIGVSLTQSYGTGGSPTTGESISGTNWTLTSTWTKYTHTFTTNTLVGKTFGSNADDFLQLEFWHMWNTTYDATVGASTNEDFGGSGVISIAQVQLCAGSVALPFQPKSYEDELRACQRYCWVFSPSSVFSQVAAGNCNGTTTARTPIMMPTELRTKPTLTATASEWQVEHGSTATTLTAISIPSNQNDTQVVPLDLTVASGLTVGTAAILRANNSTSVKLILDAEL